MPSITPDSPPETPLKPPFQMAVDSKTPARKKVPDSPTKVHGDGSMSPAQNGGLDSPVKKEKVLQSQSQIPTSAQAPEPNQAGKPQEIHSDDDLETSGDENESQADVTQEDPDAELPDFDYEGLEAQYREAITKATNKEDELLREFEAYSQLFSAWSQAAAERDNDRATKRLKTRERYVELAEESLQTKKKHYDEVVGAFQRALDLLRQ